ncbi:MAG: monovalent cation/H+ antiporter subunit D [Marivibrio sp.]|uniref:monovalent cation/H+ antiporter subunit D n=1 Tax=Marivibrio sp. TaxID=2039719 RepID=UPI0032EF10C5
MTDLTLNHWIVAPIILPALLAPIIVLAMRHDLFLQRVFSIAGTLALLAIAIGLTVQAAGGPPQSYELGNWDAPFGIVMVLDRLSALMVLLTGVLALVVVSYATASGWDRRGRHFHALFQFQLMGVCGAFLTGDLFNLFVFFEVLLIASYGLMLHGGGAKRTRAGVQYVAVNLVGSTLFLIAVGALYGVTGTLNMADMAVRAAQVPAADQAIFQTAGVLLLIVFAIKAATVPVQFWLPGAYANAPGPVAALFAIMTKVGAYAILRVYTLVFGAAAGDAAWLAADWLLPAALITLAVGMVGVLGAKGLVRLVCFAVIGSMGTLMIAIALFTPQATTAALYYLLHSTFAAAALFLLVDQVVARRRAAGDRIETAPRFLHLGLFAALFFAGAIGMAGMPPLSGFVGKLLVLDAAAAVPQMGLIWAVVLITSLICIVGFARAGSTIFWKADSLAPPSDQDQRAAAPSQPAPSLAVGAVSAMVVGMAALTLFAGPITGYLDATAAQLYEPAGYIRAVLGPDALAGR